MHGARKSFVLPDVKPELSHWRLFVRFIAFDAGSFGQVYPKSSTGYTYVARLQVSAKKRDAMRTIEWDPVNCLTLVDKYEKGQSWSSHGSRPRPGKQVHRMHRVCGRASRYTCPCNFFDEMEEIDATLANHQRLARPCKTNPAIRRVSVARRYTYLATRTSRDPASCLATTPPGTKRPRSHRAEFTGKCLSSEDSFRSLARAYIHAYCLPEEEVVLIDAPVSVTVVAKLRRVPIGSFRVAGGKETELKHTWQHFETSSNTSHGL
ncbi:uncharacterized protein LOC143152789 isoform X2 [Ptiloglossa arizonensis]|uniref:uncharacterized protein LOC143152789 isoform X2 n=1 Tax=Ptiloglossa arizonensis TaxID=3350558 RepID=UPI003F9ECFBC